MKSILAAFLFFCSFITNGQNYLGWTRSDIQSEMKQNSDMETLVELDQSDDGNWYIGYMSKSKMTETIAYFFDSNSSNSKCKYVSWTTSKNNLSDWVDFLAMNCRKLNNMNWLDETKSILYTLSEPRSNVLQIDIKYY